MCSVNKLHVGAYTHCYFPRTLLLDISAAVIQAGQARTVTRTLTNVPAIPAKTEALVLTALTATLVLAHHSGQAHSARRHSKVCGCELTVLVLYFGWQLFDLGLCTL